MGNWTVISNEYDAEKWSLFLEKVVENYPKWLQTFTIFIHVAIFTIGLFGNVFTCLVIYYDKKMHTATNYYLFNMAVTDILVSFAIFLQIHLNYVKSFNFGNIVCKAYFCFLLVLFYSSILVITTLAIERYLAVRHPLLLKRVSSWRRVKNVLIVIWIIAICETAPEVITARLVKLKTGTICCTVPTPLARVTNGVLALLTFIIPLLIILFCYIMIAFKVNTSERLNSKTKTSKYKDNRGKVNKLVVIMTLTFVICWLPFFSLRLVLCLYDIHQVIQLEQFWTIGSGFSMTNTWFSIVLNPIIFSLMSSKFRKAFKTLWKRKVGWQNSFKATVNEN